MKKTIRSKIMLFSSGLLLMLLICQILFSVFLSKSYYTNLKMSQVETLFDDLKKDYSDNLSTIITIIEQAETAHNIRVQIFNNNGLVYGNLGLNIMPVELNFLYRDTIYSLEPKATISSVSDVLAVTSMPQLPNISLPDVTLPNHSNASNIILTGRFEYNGDYHYVRIATPVEAIDASVAVITKINTIISVVILIIGIISSFVFAKFFSRPIQNIQEVARNVSLLNFNIRAEENLSTIELCDLSRSINIMSDKIKGLISDLQASNEQLRADVDQQMRLDKMRREFVANVSHELKTPLHLLLMYAENLKSNIDGLDKDYYCTTIIEETNRLNDMVKSLLDLSAIEHGLTKMEMEKFNLSEISQCVVSKMAPLCENLSVNVNIEKGIYIEGDSRYIEQAIKNYMVNAFSHTTYNGQIEIELKRQNNNVIFSIYNEGNPIAEEDIEQIWDSFYKTDKARVLTDESHSGLGLYVVKTIIGEHGGDYGVRNIREGVSFWFSLNI